MRTMRFAIAALMLALTAGQAKAAFITNGSFESGFSGWGTQDLASPFVPLAVRPNGYSPGYSFFTTSATDGSNVASSGFDGGGPGTIRIYQDIGTITAASDLLTFDFRAAWNMLDYSGSSLNRVFSVNVYSAGGFGTLLTSSEQLRAIARTKNLDTGNMSGQVDLSALIGQSVRISFDQYIPQSLTGPGNFQLDNVRLTAAPTVTPEPTSLALAGFAGIGMAVGAWRRRRQEKQAA